MSCRRSPLHFGVWYLWFVKISGNLCPICARQGPRWVPGALDGRPSAFSTQLFGHHQAAPADGNFLAGKQRNFAIITSSCRVVSFVPGQISRRRFLARTEASVGSISRDKCSWVDRTHCARPSLELTERIIKKKQSPPFPLRTFAFCSVRAVFKSISMLKQKAIQ